MIIAGVFQAQSGQQTPQKKGHDNYYYRMFLQFLLQLEGEIGKAELEEKLDDKFLHFITIQVSQWMTFNCVHICLIMVKIHLDCLEELLIQTIIVDDFEQQIAK